MSYPAAGKAALLLRTPLGAVKGYTAFPATQNFYRNIIQDASHLFQQFFPLLGNFSGDKVINQKTELANEKSTGLYKKYGAALKTFDICVTFSVIIGFSL